MSPGKDGIEETGDTCTKYPGRVPLTPGEGASDVTQGLRRLGMPFSNPMFSQK